LGSGRKNAKKSFLDGNWQEIQWIARIMAGNSENPTNGALK
jgi:hypothetical protein